MRRPAAIALGGLVAISLLLSGCGGSPPAAKAPAVPVGNLAAPLALAPLLLGTGEPATLLAGGGPEGLAAPFVVAPAPELPRLAREGFTVVGGLCRTSPQVLLWHGESVFSWTDLTQGPLYVAPGADLATLAIVIARYRNVLEKLPKVEAVAGGVETFREDPTSFLLAPEPLASALVAKGQAQLAQPLADELGPYPTCLVFARSSVLKVDPLLVVALLRRLDAGLWQIAAESAKRELPQLRALAPTLPATAILRAMAAAKVEGIFRDSVLLDDQDLRLLHEEIAPGEWPPGALDLAPAREALEKPFVP
jgi:hypothetical protein